MKAVRVNQNGEVASHKKVRGKEAEIRITHYCAIVKRNID